MLAMADKNGRVISSVPGLADMARVPIEGAVAALEKLEAPDKWSSSPDYEGRRIEKIERGWRLLNHARFRAIQDEEERRAYMKEYMRKRRERNAVNNPVSNISSSKQRKPGLAQAEAEADTEVLRTSVVSIPVNGKSSLQGEVLEKARPPENLHPINYATKLLEEIKFPHTTDNLRIVGAAIEAEIKAGKSGPSAYEFVLAGTLDAKTEGREINRFFFADAKYRIENRSNGHKPKDSLAERNRRAFNQAMGRAT